MEKTEIEAVGTIGSARRRFDSGLRIPLLGPNGRPRRGFNGFALKFPQLFPEAS
jgi:hypothetical protein